MVVTIASETLAREPQKAEKKTPKPYNTTPGRFHFFLRRFHSAMGLIFGAYVVVHLSVNASGFSPNAYQGYVNHIHGLEPALPVIELIAIFIPLLVHTLYGIYIAWAGVKFNTTRYNYFGNLRYTLQRVTAVILLLFLAFHIGTLHKWGLAGVRDVINWWGPADGGFLAGTRDWCLNCGGLFEPENAYESTARGIKVFFYDSENPDRIGLGNLLVMGFYLLGIWSATFHFANGLWTSAIAWGLTTTARAQKRWGHVCLAFFIVLTAIGTAAWLAFTVFAKL